MDPLDEALLAAIHLDREGHLQRLPELLDRCDPDALWLRAGEQGVELALAVAVRAAHDVDARFLVRAADSVRVARSRTEAQLRTLIEADALLAAEGVQALWLRGPALSVAAYGDAFARRPGRDLDLLVREKDLHRAQVLAPGIDVACGAPGLTATFDELRARARTVDVGVPVLTLADVDHVQVLAARASRRRRARYGDWLDLASLIGAEAGSPRENRRSRLRRLLRWRPLRDKP